MKKTGALLLLIFTLMACGAQAQPQPSGAMPESLPGPSEIDKGHPYPRLGMWWLDPYTASPEAMGRYDLLLDSFEDEELKTKLAQVRAANPTIKVLKPLSPAERALFWEDEESGESRPNPEIAQLPSGFFLLQVGTVLEADLGPEETELKVAQTQYPDGVPMFHEGGEIAIGEGESARVLEVDTDTNTLTVERGYVRKASSHRAGEHVAAHIRFWPGSWVMNVTADCPRVLVAGVDHPVNWVEYYFALISGQSKGIYQEPWENWDAIGTISLYDGIVLDRFEDKESWLMWPDGGDEVVQLDLKHTNTQTPAAPFDASWQAGTDRLLQLLRAEYPTATIIRNNPLTERFAPYDGQVYESGGWSAPSQAWWEGLFLQRNPEEYYDGVSYLQWFREPQGKPLVMMEVYEDEGSPEADGDEEYHNPYEKPGFVPNYQRMRFSLTSALLGDGYYSYEINTDGHGSLGLMWFDEYDNGGKGKGYLGYPRESARRLPSGVYQRGFDHGLVLVNPQGSPVTVTLNPGYRKIKGTQVPAINDGGAVTQVTLSAYDGIILLGDN